MTMDIAGHETPPRGGEGAEAQVPRGRSPEAGGTTQEGPVRIRLVPRNAALLLVPGLGPLELVLIVFALLLIFGAKRIPLIARGLGEGIRDFKKSLAGTDEENGESKRLESGTKDDD